MTSSKSPRSDRGRTVGRAVGRHATTTNLIKATWRRSSAGAPISALPNRRAGRLATERRQFAVAGKRPTARIERNVNDAIKSLAAAGTVLRYYHARKVAERLNTHGGPAPDAWTVTSSHPRLPGHGLLPGIYSRRWLRFGSACAGLRCVDNRNNVSHQPGHTFAVTTAHVGQTEPHNHQLAARNHD
jgi:hypothetical protein